METDKDFVSCLLQLPLTTRGLLTQSVLKTGAYGALWRRLLLLWFQSCDGLGLWSGARRAMRLLLHLCPEDVDLLAQMERFTLLHGPFDTGQAEQLKLSQLLYDDMHLARTHTPHPRTFELRMHFLRQMLQGGQYDTAMRFATQYFRQRYVVPIGRRLQEGLQDVDRGLKYYEVVNLSSHELAEFKAVSDEFLRVGQWDKSLHVLRLACQLQPTEGSLFYQMYEICARQERWLQAFKWFAHYMHLSTGATSGSVAGSTDQYRICGDLLERAGRYWHSFLAYYRAYRESHHDPKLLVHIHKNILPKMHENYAMSDLPIELRERLLSSERITLPPVADLSLDAASLAEKMTKDSR